MHPWLRRLRHDLVKRAVWPARDLRDSGATDLDALRRGLRDLRDEDGNSLDVLSLWERLRAEAPAAADGALDAFGKALAEASRTAAGDDFRGALEAVLRIELAFEVLARTLDAEG